MILSTHVDDLKGAARREMAEKLLKHLEDLVGRCSQEWKTFTHTGIEHEETQAGVYAHQGSYAKQLQPMSMEKLRGKDADIEVDEHHQSLYMSLLGGV
eukprot:8438197-Karenia_brevis.AAC.1